MMNKVGAWSTSLAGSEEPGGHLDDRSCAAGRYGLTVEQVSDQWLATGFGEVADRPAAGGSYDSRPRPPARLVSLRSQQASGHVDSDARRQPLPGLKWPRWARANGQGELRRETSARWPSQRTLRDAISGAPLPNPIELDQLKLTDWGSTYEIGGSTNLRVRRSESC